MAEHKVMEDVYGPGTFTDREFIPLLTDCRRLLKHLADTTPGFPKDAAKLEDVEFVGNDLPLLPGPLKAQALTAVVHAMIGIAAKEILAMKKIDAEKVKIDVDKAGLYPAGASLVSVNGKTMADMHQDGSMFKMGTDLDKGTLTGTPMALCSWSIYPTRDNNVWYQVMSNLDSKGYLKAFGLDVNAPVKSNDEAYEMIKAEMVKYSARELEMKNQENGWCGQTCDSPKFWRETLMGKSLARHPLVNYSKVLSNNDLPSVPFPVIPGDDRPLAGIKVVELARVIAGPALGAVLTSLGAEVCKVESPNLPDPNVSLANFSSNMPS